MRLIRYWLAVLMLVVMAAPAQAVMRVTIVAGEVGPVYQGSPLWITYGFSLAVFGYESVGVDSSAPGQVNLSYYSDPRGWVQGETPPSNAAFLASVSVSAKSQALLARPDLNDSTVFASAEYREALGGLYALCLITLQANPGTALQQFGADGVRALNTVADLAGRIRGRLDGVTNGVADRNVYVGIGEGNALIDAVEAYLHHLGSGNYATRGVRFIQAESQVARVADLSSTNEQVVRTITRALTSGAGLGVSASTATPVAGQPVDLVTLHDPRVSRWFVSSATWNFGDGSPVANLGFVDRVGVATGIAHTYAQPGIYTFTKTETHRDGQVFVASNIVTVGAAPPPPPTPTVTGVTPLTAPAETSATITVTGSALPSTVVMTLGGQACTLAIYVSTQAVFSCNPSSPGTAALVVLSNSVANGGQPIAGGSMNFTVTAPPPPPPPPPPIVVTDVTPPFGQSGTTVRMTVNGTGLPLTMVLSLDAMSCTPVSRTSTVATYDCALGAQGPVYRSLWTDTAGNGGTEIVFSETGFFITAP